MAIDVLIRFMKIVLCEIGGDEFSPFSDSIYLAKKAIGLIDQFHSFVSCPKCHKLYQKQEVVDFKQEDIPTVMKCQHVEFPNSPLRNSRICNTQLSLKIGTANRTIIQPKLIYPFSGIKQQLVTLYRRPGFERYLRHWENRQ